MPEEVNRRCVDAISDLLFTTDVLADANLRREGTPPERIHFVGNVMIDTLTRHVGEAERLDYPGRLGLAPRGYATLTLHRPANVEAPERLAEILGAVIEAADGLPVVFPVHPRTRRRIEALGAGVARPLNGGGPAAGINTVDPLGYLEFLSLNRAARIVFTDSGGLQEETAVLGVPCITLRETTERPITLRGGANRLAGVTRAGILAASAAALADEGGPQPAPDKWDGRAAERIADVLDEIWGTA